MAQLLIQHPDGLISNIVKDSFIIYVDSNVPKWLLTIAFTQLSHTVEKKKGGGGGWCVRDFFTQVIIIKLLRSAKRPFRKLFVLQFDNIYKGLYMNYLLEFLKHRTYCAENGRREHIKVTYPGTIITDGGKDSDGGEDPCVSFRVCSIKETSNCNYKCNFFIKKKATLTLR